MTRHRSSTHGPRAAAATCLVVGLVLATPALAQSPDRAAGSVDGSAFIELAGDEAVTIEVSLPGPLLRAIMRFDPDLAELGSGLESIHAVVLSLEDERTATRLKDLVRETERKLQRRGWVRLARVRDQGAEFKVLVLLHGEEKIQGLVVMHSEDEQLIFANIAGVLDLAAIAEIGEHFGVPGLDELKAEEE